MADYSYKDSFDSADKFYNNVYPKLFDIWSNRAGLTVKDFLSNNVEVETRTYFHSIVFHSLLFSNIVKQYLDKDVYLTELENYFTSNNKLSKIEEIFPNWKENIDIFWITISEYTYSSLKQASLLATISSRALEKPNPSDMPLMTTDPALFYCESFLTMRGLRVDGAQLSKANLAMGLSKDLQKTVNSTYPQYKKSILFNYYL